MRWKRLGVLACAGGLCLPATASAAQDRIAWSPCSGRAECGTLHVPLDHDEPHGTQIRLSVARLPATDRSRRIGSLLVNPGGPGGSGVGVVQHIGDALFTEEVRARYDIVGFDPRGIAGSSPLRCYGDERQWAEIFTPFAFPESDADVEAWAAGERRLIDACRRRGGRIVSHMATADVARDMDRLRAALGDRQLHYYGISYGSYLGTTYANLFPQRVGRLVVDAVLDPVAWSTGRAGEEGLPFSTRLRSPEGTQATLDEFLRLCDAGEGCAFAPRAAERFKALYAALRERPLDGFDHRWLTIVSLIVMYDSAEWPWFAGLLADLERRAGGAEAARSAVARLGRTAAFLPRRGKFPYYNAVEGFPAVACADGDNPDAYASWTAAAARAAREQSAVFGPAWTWFSSICAEWPFADEDRYTGPWNATTANPVLVIGNRFDPATPYHGARVVRGLLPRSSLLTLDGWGHSAVFASRCIDRAVERYFIAGETSDGQVCAPDVVPFAG